MPVNFQQIYRRVREIAEGAHESKKILEERRIRARELLALYASDLDFLRRKVEIAKESDVNLRCAGPFTDSLASFCPPPATITDATIIAADGSQVNPDRHSAVQFCIINVGVIVRASAILSKPFANCVGRRPDGRSPIRYWPS